jgi:hypothetical protein
LAYNLRPHRAAVAQLDRVPGFERVKGWFESRGDKLVIRSLGGRESPQRRRSDQGVTARPGLMFVSARP